MNADEALCQLIKSDALSAAYLQGRVYPDVARQETGWPYCTIDDQGGEDEVYLDGPSGKPKGQWSVEIWATTPDEARMVANWVRLKLNGFDGWIYDTLFEAMSASLPEADSTEDDAAPGNFYYSRRFTVTAFYSECPEPRQYTLTGG